ncbi:MAG: IS110 family transposase [Phycisphaerales bacterium]|nr:IS110 family transposase [Phycisphaerales bacterium]
MKKFVGVDLHKQRIVVCVVNQARQVLTSARFTHAESNKLAAWLKALGSFDLVLEATASYEWFVKLVEPLAGRVLLAHPRKMRIIAESTRKSDKVDARVLAEFLALDMIPPAHRPTPRQRAHRKLVRRRVYVRARQTSIKNRIRHVAAEYNADRKELFTSEGLKYLRGLKLDPVDRWLVQRLLRELKLYRDELKAVDRQLAAFARTAPAAEAGHRALLNSIPAVGPVTRETFLAEVAGPERFGSQKKLTSYVGLAPDSASRPASATTWASRTAARRFCGWVLHQAAWQLVRRLVALATDLRAAGPARGKKKAITAIARRLLCLMLAVIRSGRPYQERPPATPATPAVA